MLELEGEYTNYWIQSLYFIDEEMQEKLLSQKLLSQKLHW